MKLGVWSFQGCGQLARQVLNYKNLATLGFILKLSVRNSKQLYPWAPTKTIAIFIHGTSWRPACEFRWHVYVCLVHVYCTVSIIFLIFPLLFLSFFPSPLLPLPLFFCLRQARERIRFRYLVWRIYLHCCRGFIFDVDICIFFGALESKWLALCRQQQQQTTKLQKLQQKLVNYKLNNNTVQAATTTNYTTTKTTTKTSKLYKLNNTVQAATHCVGPSRRSPSSLYPPLPRRDAHVNSNVRLEHK